jgi:hypothetical protein
MIWNSLVYVSTAYMFWQAIILTFACGIIIGMALHNGDIKGAAKAALAMIPMMMLTAAVSYFRVAPNINDGLETTKTYAGTITAIVVGSTYLFGFLSGVHILRFVYRNHPHTI